MELLPRLLKIGVCALKIEGRQRGVAYVSTVTHAWRSAIDRCSADAAHWVVEPAWKNALSAHAEGHQTTLGPYHRAWHCGLRIRPLEGLKIGRASCRERVCQYV